MTFTPYLTSLFLLEILVIVILVSTFLFCAIYVLREDRAIERSRVAARDNPTDKEARLLPETEFYYLRTGRLRSSIAMKVRLYSLEDYGRELRRTGEARGTDGFVVALKAYGYHVDHWYEMSCGQAITGLGLRAEECEADETCGALLLRKLPRGISDTSWGKLDRPEDLRLFAPEGGSSQGSSQSVNPAGNGYGG